MADRRYHWLLRLLPRSFREDHETEMLQVWRDEQREAAAEGRRAPWVAAARDTLRVAPREHAATAIRNLRVAVRRLRRAPSFTITAILTLALGTGAAASVFSLFNAVLLRPLPWRSPESIGLIWPVQPSGERTWLSFPEVEDLQHDLTSVAGVAGFTDVRPALVSAGGSAELQALAVSNNFLALLGITPIAGRDFTPVDDRPGAMPVVILGHMFWRAQFAADPSIVGRTITLDERSYVVIGILPKDFAIVPPTSVLPDRVDVWLPLQPHLTSRDRTVRFLHALARVRDANAFAETGDELRTYAARVQQASATAYPNGRWTFEISRFADAVLGPARMPLYLLLALVSLVLLIACINVASLLLIRGQARRGELALRTALGAGPAKLAGELFAETLVLATLGCLLGLALASATPPVLRALDPSALPRLDEASVDLTVLGFMAGLVLLTAAFFTAIPMIERMRSATPGVVTSARGGTQTRRSARLGSTLVVLQTALATTIVIAALLLTETFIRLQHVDLGFNPDGVLTGRITLSSKYRSGPDAVRFFERAINEVTRVSGVKGVAAVTQLPLSGAMLSSAFLVGPETARQRIDADLRGVTPTYFDVMNVPMREGRAFTEHDSAANMRVAIVDESFARRLRADGRVVGQRIRWFRQPDDELEIVGVVADVRHRGPVESARETVYRPLQQYPRSSMFMVVKTAGQATTLGPEVRAALASIDPTQPFADVRMMTTRFEHAMSRARTSLMLASVLGLLALVLAMVGLYGVLSYAVARRTREFGIRIALGATPESVRALVLKEGLRLTLTGTAFGVASAAIVKQIVETALYGVADESLRPYVLAVLLILGSSAIAYWIPARRARNTDIATTLQAGA